MLENSKVLFYLKYYKSNKKNVTTSFELPYYMNYLLVLFNTTNIVPYQNQQHSTQSQSTIIKINN